MTPEPLPRLLDRTFLEHRAKLLELAAFLDRCDRVGARPPTSPGNDDYRLAQLRDAITLLSDGRPERTRRILEALSDPSTDLLDHAPAGPATGVPGRPPRA
ncbi:MAG: hypothetical protein AAGG38_06440 [Planctomycetota bacterium]